MPLSLGDGPLPIDQIRKLLPQFTDLLSWIARAARPTPNDLQIQWDGFDLSVGDTTTSITFANLQVSGKLLAGKTIAGDLRLSFKDSNFQSGDSYFRRYEPDRDNIIPLTIIGLQHTSNAYTFSWIDPHVGYWLRNVAPNLYEDSPRTDAAVTLQVLLGNAGELLVKEVRLEWSLVTPAPRSFVLPGLKATLPDSTLYTLAVQAAVGTSPQLALLATLGGGKATTAASTFAWGRDGDRELQNDEKPQTDPLFQATLTPNQPVSLVLAQVPLGESKLPAFFHQLAAPLVPLDINNPATLGNPLAIAPTGLKSDSWMGSLRVNLQGEDNPFTLPFLKRSGDETTNQLIQLYSQSDLSNLSIDVGSGTVQFPVGVRLQLLKIRFDLACTLVFNLATFALQVNHDEGVALFTDQPQQTFPDLFGLNARFTGKPLGNGSFHYFTLATKNYHYQVQQAPGASVALDFNRASEEPITFNVGDFALTPKGLNLTADVSDRPARLNGIQTRFRFTNSRFEIRENRVNDFTLSGSGPLPPALVGDATADIALQFSQLPNGNLTLVQGSARLRGNKLLDCKGTRFQFSVDALGLKFVDDGRFHLYFTLTGNAQFVLAPGDDADGPLALLGKTKIDLVECPLTGEVKVIARHVKFLIELPKPKSFNFLGCFEMELRAIGFVPQADVFEGDGAMLVTGQLKFAQGAGDTPDSRPDYHQLYIGLPAPGSFVPRIHFTRLAVNLNIGEAFRLNGVVDFVDKPDQTGLIGSGMLQIQGLPTLAASFGFLRVRRDPTSPWLRAWFIYLEIREVSFMIPVIQIYIREVGLGFGYRFTLASIKAADVQNDVKKLLKELQTLSRTQGDLSRPDRWSVDLEGPGEDPRWTIVLRAMISQTSTSPVISLNRSEAGLACLFLLDAVIAFRSDLTFFMAARGWINTNYVDYVDNVDNCRENPLVSGFVLLSPRKKRFLAHVANNPGIKPGKHQELPAFIQEAIANSRFSATLLVEPGLLHYELGWPNMLGWSADFGGIVKVDIKGGFIFRLSTDALVIGISVLARGSLNVSAGFDFGIVGCRVSCSAAIAFGTRMIGVLSLTDLTDLVNKSGLYAAIGLEAQIAFSIEFWLRVELVFTSFTLNFRFSLSIYFTAGLEQAYDGLSLLKVPAMRGSGTVAVSCCGHDLQLTVKLGIREDAVQKALDNTKDYLKMGLEATEVEGVPGVEAPARPMALLTEVEGGPGVGAAALPMELLAFRMDSPASPRLQIEREVMEAASTPFKVPGYSIFIIRKPGPENFVYFVLLPQGEQQVLDANGHLITIPETGFLPSPPTTDQKPNITSDFLLTIPALAADEQYSLQHYQPLAEIPWVDVTGAIATAQPISWRVNWNAPIIDQAQTHQVNSQTQQVIETRTRPILLDDYLSHAFQQRNNGTVDNPQMTVIGNPDPLPYARTPVTDPRVQNPTDDSFEAAVRGAIEQFSGSPFFKSDPNQLYDQLLQKAFDHKTTIYASEGKLPENDDALKAMQQNQQAYQLRGVIIHNLVADLQDYVNAASDAEREALVERSVAFQMGLVFRISAEVFPAWLEQIVTAPEGVPTIQQRTSTTELSPTAAGQPVRTFNVRETDFQAFPPQFQKVRQYSDAGTIAIVWDLTWGRSANEHRTPAQADPQHHLLHYQVRRRSLDGQEPEAFYTVKPAKALHREKQSDNGNAPNGEDTLSLLQPRFQIVDHFSETAEDLAALPAQGRSYLYTITPIDFAGNSGRPLTLVATRKPNQPPLVPTDGDLTIRYQIPRSAAEPLVGDPAPPAVLPPYQVFVEWTEPVPPLGLPVPVKERRLIFRRESTVPIGSYGLDSTTQRPGTAGLPTSNARPLPTDRKITIPPDAIQIALDRLQVRQAAIPLVDLQKADVLPVDLWRPEAWRVFFQTISDNDVPSALAPVQLRLMVEAADEIAPPAPVGTIELAKHQREERRPAELEWLPKPLRFPVLPPEDQRAQPGTAYFPILKRAGSFQFSPDLASAIAFQPHPSGIRAIQLRWNQGASEQSTYPLELNAGYRLHELNIDAATTEVFASGERIAQELRQIQDVQMLPAADMLLIPGDTLNTSQWEAWYAGAVRRRKSVSDRPAGSQTTLAPWYSWQESYLEFPIWEGLTEPFGRRTAILHPFLEKLLKVIAALRPFGRTSSGYAVAQQVSTPIQPNNLDGLLNSTPAQTDPYGWAILQRLGLSVAFSLYDPDNGTLVSGQSLLDLIQSAFDAINAENLLDLKAQWQSLKKHLHIELLFQPGRSVQVMPTPSPNSDVQAVPQSPDPASLLALVQISLRPTVHQVWRYGEVRLEGAAGATVELRFSFPPAPDARLSLVNQSDPAAGQVEIAPSPNLIQRSIKLPLNGKTAILLRGTSLPSVSLAVPLKQPANDAALTPLKVAGKVDTVGDRLLVVKQPLTTDDRDLLRAALSSEDAKPGAAADLAAALQGQTTFEATDERTPYFIVPLEGWADFFIQPDGFAPNAPWNPWLRLKYYLESLNSTNPQVPASDKIILPTSRDEILKLLPRILPWLQRFFDASGDLTGLDPQTQLPTTGDGPWLATAYPRAGSPAYVAPDESGRLTYTHLLEDQWAHTYRYYIQPYSRYGLLWQSLRRSPTLFPGLAATDLPDVHIDPAAGGLDVVVERTQPVAAPLVISSRRLDAAATPAKPPAPGRVWEVLVAQHPEQTLIERNQTLARQLGFRQVAFTLLRRFAYVEWLYWLQQRNLVTVERPLEIALVENQYPDIPTAYPNEPDYVNVESLPLDDDTIRSLDLPERTNVFSQGALALQWEALPFYYEHKLLLIAQTASTVSTINSVTQRDLTYRSPLPLAQKTGIDTNWTPVLPFDDLTDGLTVIAVRAQLIEIPLRRFWDSLPEEAQLQWLAEQPDSPESGAIARKLSSLPDPDVVYQLVEVFSGNIEVQAEFFYDATTQQFAMRQLGRRQLATLLGVRVPATPQGDYVMQVALLLVTQEQLEGTYNLTNLIDPTLHKVAYSGQQFSFAGVMEIDDYRQLLAQWDGSRKDVATLARLYQSWDSQEAVSRTVVPPNADLQERISFPEATMLVLRWEGVPTAEEQAALLALNGDDSFRNALQTLVNRAASGAGGFSGVEIPAGPDQIPAPLQGRISFNVDAQGQTYTSLKWIGGISSDEAAALRLWAKIPAFTDAVEALTKALTQGTMVPNETTIPLSLPVRPQPDALPPLLRDQLLLGRLQMRFHGVMTPEEGQLLASLYANRPDRQAILRLHNASQESGQRDHTLMICSRRGSAVPSPLQPITPQILPAETP